MRIADAFRDRLDPSSHVFVEGSEEDRKRARVQWHRDRVLAEVMSSGLEELRRADLAFGRSS